MQKLLQFMAIGVYLTAIFTAEVDYHHTIVSYSRDSTKENPVVKGKVCFAEKPGNIDEWIRLEINTFYL